jgi:GNAT superfamily N-acetyltransferase
VDHRVAALRENQDQIDLTSRIGDRNQIVKQVFEQAGYVSDLSFLIMEIVMTAPPHAAQWPAEITVRPFVAGQDEEATYRADEEASEDKGYHQPMTFEAWAGRMNLQGAGFDPALWFLACDQDDVVGVALNVYSQDTNTGWVDHLGVRKRWRNQGIGMNLLLHSFETFYRRDVHRVKLSVDSKSLTNAPRLYERAGMRTIQQYHIYRKILKFSN